MLYVSGVKCISSTLPPHTQELSREVRQTHVKQTVHAIMRVINHPDSIHSLSIKDTVCCLT